DIKCDTPDHREVFLALQPGDDVQTGLWNPQSETVAKQFIELFDKEISPLRIDFSHPLDVTQEKSLADKTRQRRLVDRRGVLIHRTADLDQRINQRLWRNDVAQTQRGTKNLAHRSCVNHSAGVVDPLQRRKRWPGKAELRVVVVLENECVVSTRKIEQARPALESHGNAERKLMGGCYMNKPRQWFFWRSRNDQSLAVELLGNYLDAGQGKDPADLLITGVFDPGGFTWIQHSHSANQHRLLHASRDYDLIRMTTRRSEIAQVCCDCLAQVSVAAIRRIAQQVDAFLRQNLRSEAFPDVHRKFVDCRNAGDQRDACVRGRCAEVKLISDARIRNCSHAIRDAKWALDWLVGFRLVRGQKGLRKNVRNECPALGL